MGPDMQANVLGMIHNFGTTHKRGCGATSARRLIGATDALAHSVSVRLPHYEGQRSRSTWALANGTPKTQTREQNGTMRAPQVRIVVPGRKSFRIALMASNAGTYTSQKHSALESLKV